MTTICQDRLVDADDYSGSGAKQTFALLTKVRSCHSPS